MNFHILLLIVVLLANVSTFSARTVGLQTVKEVDLNRYLGLWYQTAYYPNSFQPKDCGFTTAEYSMSAKGDIIVHNVCWEDKNMTKVKKQIKGKAFPANNTNTKLKVQFFWPFKGDYWIIDLDEKDYSYAVVSEPRRKYLWILSRAAVMDGALYQEILGKLKTRGFDLERIAITGQVNLQP